MAKKIEDLAGLDFTSDLSRDLEELVDMMSLIGKVDCPESIKPMISPLEHDLCFQVSERPAVKLATRDEILSNASKTKEGFFAISKIINR